MADCPTFLVTDLKVLTKKERSAWIGAYGRYCVLGGTSPKRVAVRRSCSDLLRTSGRPLILSIRQAFAKGDKL